MREAVLEFGDFPDDEVRVRISGIPVGEFFAVRDAFAALTWDTGPMEEFGALFAPYLLSWTFDSPIEAGVFGHHLGLGIAIVREWMKAVRDVPLPLPERSSDTTPSEDPSPTS